MSGFASFNGFADREPVLPPMYLADTVAGLYGAPAVMVALREVEQNGGRGQVVDLPLLDPLLAVLGPQAANYPPDRQGEAAHGQPIHQHRPAQRLPLQGWPLRRAVGRGAEDGRAPVPRDRPSRARRRPAFPHQRRPGEERRRARRDHRRLHGAAHAGRERGVLRAGRGHHRTDLRCHADPGGPARDRARAPRRLPRPEMGAFPMHHVVPRLAGTPGSIRGHAGGSWPRAFAAKKAAAAASR